MRMKLARAAAILLLGGVLGAPVGADVIGEGVNTVRCTEEGDIELPKKMSFEQMILSDHFATLGQMALTVWVHYEEEPGGKGKVIATATQIKPDATEIKLGRVTAKLKGGEGDKLKVVDAVIEPGDRIRWQAKLKGLPDLKLELGGCWELNLAVYVADEVPT